MIEEEAQYLADLSGTRFIAEVGAEGGMDCALASQQEQARGFSIMG